MYPDLAAVRQGLEKTNVNDSFQIQHAANLYERLYPILEPAYLRPGGERRSTPRSSHFQCTLAQAVMDLMSVRYLVADRAIPLKSVGRDRGPDRRGRRSGGTGRPCRGLTWCLAPWSSRGGRETVARRLSELDPRPGC